MSVMTLEIILQKHFGCKKPVLKKPKPYIAPDGYESLQYMSDAGLRAYDRLVDLIYDLNKLTEDEYQLYGLVEDLDIIADGDNIILLEGADP